MPVTPTIIFDLDGTLVDSVRDLIPALNRTIEPEGLQPVPDHDVSKVVGQGAVKMIERAYMLNQAALGEEKRNELLARFLETYEDRIAENTIFFDGCLEALDILRSKGWEFAVCTNKYEHLARKLLGELGTIDRFVAITGGDTFDVKKPHPDHILKTLALTNGDLESAIMVGDSINDIAAALAANVPSIAVDFGYTEQPVTEMGADIVISHFNEFVEAVESLRPNAADRD